MDRDSYILIAEMLGDTVRSQEYFVASLRAELHALRQEGRIDRELGALASSAYNELLRMRKAKDAFSRIDYIEEVAA